MAFGSLGNLVQKAVYLGIGVASYAGEKAGEKLTEVRSQAQKLADEMVARGEMTTDEARRFVDDMIHKAQSGTVSPGAEPPQEPRKIEILDEDEAIVHPPTTEADPAIDPVAEMRRQVAELQEELRRLKNL